MRRRPFAEMSTRLIIAATFILAAVFGVGYQALVRPKSFGSGLFFGCSLGMALGAASGVGTYVHSPIPVAPAWAGWLLGVAKRLVVGGILGVLLVEWSSKGKRDS